MFWINFEHHFRFANVRFRDLLLLPCRFNERGKRREWSHIRRVSQMLELLTQVQTTAKVRGGPQDQRPACVARIRTRGQGYNMIMQSDSNFDSLFEELVL